MLYCIFLKLVELNCSTSFLMGARGDNENSKRPPALGSVVVYLNQNLITYNFSTNIIFVAPGAPNGIPAPSTNESPAFARPHSRRIFLAIF